MKNYNNEQKMAIAKVLLDIIYVDGKIDGREISYYERVKNSFDMSPENQFAVVGLNTLCCLGIIKAMDDEQKLSFVNMMRETILSDEYIDPKEAEAFYNICEFIHVTGVGLS